ncbi:AAA family ATPase, partial [Streptomyces rubiginosohelvolus]
MSAPPPAPTGPVGTAGPAGSDDAARAALEALRSEIAKAVVGQDPAVTGLVVALLCRGHV